MYRVLIADDERMIIKGLKKLIKWQEEGFEIIGEAYNGEDLIHLTIREEPDLVVTDISMPRMSGIDFIQALREKGYQTKVIFISAYEDFSYAKNALQYGAKGYVIKPIDKVNLKTEISKVKQEMDEERQNVDEKAQLITLKNKSVERKNLTMIQSIAEGEEIIDSHKLEEISKVLKKPCFTVVSAFYDKERTFHLENAMWGETEEKLLLFSVRNIINDLKKQVNVSAYFLEEQEQAISLLINHEYEEDLNAFSTLLVTSLSEIMNIHLYMGIGKTVDHVEDIHASKKLAIFHKDFYYFQAPKQIIKEKDIMVFERNISADNLTEYRQSIYQAIIKKDEKEVTIQLHALFNWLFFISNGKKEIVISTVFSILSELRESLKKMNMDLYPGRKNIDLLNKLYSFHTFIDLKAYISSLVSEFMATFLNQETFQDNYQLREILDYLEKHYYQNITLESIAEKMHMNPYYFSSFFKKSTGVNFKKYLTKIRLENAIHLLLTSDLLIYEIAEEVGYHNVRQFSDMFKKYYGQLPTDYRQMKKAKKSEPPT